MQDVLLSMPDCMAHVDVDTMYSHKCMYSTPCGTHSLTSLLVSVQIWISIGTFVHVSMPALP